MADLGTFLIADYELKTDYLNKHFSRMLTRFNFFLTINSAMFVLSFEEGVTHAVIISQFGLALALLWTTFAAADNYSAEIYRAHISSAFELVKRHLKEVGEKPNRECLENSHDEDALTALDTVFVSHVGDTDQKSFLPTHDNKPAQVRAEILSWKIPGLGVTSVPVAVAVFFAGAWGFRWWYALNAQPPA